MYLKLVADEGSQSPTAWLKLGAVLNIERKVVADEVSQSPTGRSKLVALLNIFSKLMTLEVSQQFTVELNARALSNMPSLLKSPSPSCVNVVVLDVSQQPEGGEESHRAWTGRDAGRADVLVKDDLIMKHPSHTSDSRRIPAT